MRFRQGSGHMGINLVVAVTDDDWVEMLRRQSNLTEMKFWAPLATNFRALQARKLFCSICTRPATPSWVVASLFLSLGCISKSRDDRRDFARPAGEAAVNVPLDVAMLKALYGSHERIKTKRRP
jgi:hypothetical protein